MSTCGCFKTKLANIAQSETICALVLCAVLCRLSQNESAKVGDGFLRMRWEASSYLKCRHCKSAGHYNVLNFS